MGGNAENDGINVEMDPEDQFKVSSLLVCMCVCLCVGGGGQMGLAGTGAY
jgi:hypothetical protein